jgi:hypothetical protein
VSPPAVILRFELEAAPIVFADYLDDSEADRMDDWLDEHPEYRRLIREAVQLAEEARAA